MLGPVQVRTTLAPDLDFSGTYRNDELAITLTQQQGQYTGVITMGQKKFPLTAKPQARVLALYAFGMFLAEACGFTPRLCRPYRAKTKGKVERFNSYLKSSFVVPLAATLKASGLKLDVDAANVHVRRWLVMGVPHLALPRHVQKSG